MRHRRFCNLDEHNAAIGEMLRQLNEQRPISRLGSALPAADCSRNSIGRRASPMPLPKGGCPAGPVHGLKAHAPASITSLMSRLIFVAERLRSIRTMRIAVDIATSAQTLSSQNEPGNHGRKQRHNEEAIPASMRKVRRHRL
jgi:hypothetical protein